MTTSYTDIPKPFGTAYTNIPKPLSVTSVITNNFSGGDPIGLLLSLTYSTVTQSSVITGIWTDIPKAAGTIYTNIPKPLSVTSVITNNFSGGDPIGLLLSLTYSTVTQSSVITGIWTDIPKAAGTIYTNIAKAI